MLFIINEFLKCRKIPKIQLDSINNQNLTIESVDVIFYLFIFKSYKNERTILINMYDANRLAIN